MEVKLNVRPWLPKQQGFLEAPEKFLGYVGGLGSGKTVIISANSILLSTEYPGNRGVIASPSAPKLRDDVIPVFKEVCPEDILLGGRWDRAFHGTNLDLTFINGSIINFRAPDDADKIRGPTLGFFALDEAGMMPVEIWNAYRGRLRKPEVRLCGMVASNPESEAHWLYSKFIEQEDATPLNTYRLFQAPSTENFYLPEEYIEDLQKYPPEWREKYLEGKFTAFEGQIYKAIDEEIHFIDPADFRKIFNAQLLDCLSFGGGIDPAESQPTAAWFNMRDFEDRSWYVARYSEENRVTSQHCAALKAIIEKWGRIPSDADLVIDPSATAKRVEGRSLIDGYHENGLFPRPAESCRRQDSVIWGINLVNERLHPDPKLIHPVTGEKGCPKILFVMHPDVREGLKYIKSYRWNSQTAVRHSGRDRPHKYQDHDPDALRYRECEYQATPLSFERRRERELAREQALAELDPETGVGIY